MWESVLPPKTICSSIKLHILTTLLRRSNFLLYCPFSDANKNCVHFGCLVPFLQAGPVASKDQISIYSCMEGWNWARCYDKRPGHFGVIFRLILCYVEIESLKWIIFCALLSCAFIWTMTGNHPLPFFGFYIKLRFYMGK